MLYHIPENYEPDWRLYGNIDLSKSCAGDEDNPDHWFLRGIALPVSEDTSGEAPLLKAMDWSYFDKQGFVKYEHDPNGIPTPENVIGIPHFRKTLPQGEFLKARLIPRDENDVRKGLVKDYARATASLIKAIQEHNKQFPENQRTVGFSIEGKYLGKSEDGKKYWGKVINVVVSPNPVSTDTYAEMSKAHNLEMVKSLMTGATYGVTDQTGGAALRKESLKDELVSTTFEDNKKSRSKAMEFKDFDEAKKHYVGEGLDENEAIKKAKSLFPDNDEENEEDEVEKSTKESKSVMMKALDVIHSLVKSRKPESEDNDDEEDIQKSQINVGDPDQDGLVDITPIFQEYGNTMKQILKKSESFHDYVEAYNAEMAKILSAFSEGHFTNTEMIKSMKDRIDTLEKSLETSNKILKAIGLSANDISFLNLDKEKVVEDDGSNGKMNKAVILQRMDLAMRKGMIAPVEITKFEMTGKLPAHIPLDSLPQLGN